MINMKDFVENQIGVNSSSTSTSPVSFRCTDEIILKMDLLTKHLGFSTRSKLLSALVPIAMDEAIAHLPSQMAEDFFREYDEKLNGLYGGTPPTEV